MDENWTQRHTSLIQLSEYQKKMEQPDNKKEKSVRRQAYTLEVSQRKK